MTDSGTPVDFTEKGDGTLEERVYYCQNWRADVSALVDYTSGDCLQLEHDKYLSYGTPWGLPAGDLDSDGDYDVNDEKDIDTLISTSGYDVRADADLDGAITSYDKADLSGSKITLGRGLMSDSGTFNRRGYAGYDNDGVLGDGAISGSNTRFWHVRHRVMDSTMGRWSSRDAISDVRGMSRYSYVSSQPMVYEGAFGLSPSPIICNGETCRAPRPGISRYRIPGLEFPITPIIVIPGFGSPPTKLPPFGPTPSNPPISSPLLTPGVDVGIGLSGGGECCFPIPGTPLSLCIAISISTSTGFCSCQGLNGVCAFGYQIISTCMSVSIHGIQDVGCHPNVEAHGSVGVVSERCPSLSEFSDPPEHECCFQIGLGANDLVLGRDFCASIDSIRAMISRGDLSGLIDDVGVSCGFGFGTAGVGVSCCSTRRMADAPCACIESSR